jgi:hypothetical protein
MRNVTTIQTESTIKYASLSNIPILQLTFVIIYSEINTDYY